MLDAGGLSGCIRLMKFKFLLPLVVTLVVAAGCAKTVSGRHTAAVPFTKDSIEGRYERPTAQVYMAAKEVVLANGLLLNEVTQHNATNSVVLALEGRVQEKKVFIAVSEVDPKVSSVIVQVRSNAGVRDIDLAHELEKQIGIRLATH